MTDRHEPDRDDPRLDDPGFDDPGHAWVRDLLADARVTTPVPAEVASRLDDTLASLQARRAAERAAEEERPAVVVPLRRRLRPALVAAASLVAIVGGGLMVGQFAGTGSQNADKASSSVADDSGGSAAAGQSESGATSGTPGPPEVAGEVPKSLIAIPQLTTASFATDAARVMQQIAATTARSDTPGGAASRAPATTGTKQLQAPPVTATPQADQLDALGSSDCAGPTIAGAVTLPATLDGARVAMVFLPPTATGQRVEAWSCDGSTLLTGATVAR